MSRNEMATYCGIEISVVDVLVADSKEEAGLTEEELAYFSGQNGGEDIDTTKKKRKLGIYMAVCQNPFKKYNK